MGSLKCIAWGMVLPRSRQHRSWYRAQGCDAHLQDRALRDVGAGHRGLEPRQQSGGCPRDCVTSPSSHPGNWAPGLHGSTFRHSEMLVGRHRRSQSAGPAPAGSRAVGCHGSSLMAVSRSSDLRGGTRRSARSVTPFLRGSLQRCQRPDHGLGLVSTSGDLGLLLCHTVPPT